MSLPGKVRSAVSVTTLAYVAIGVSAFVVLASGPRLLGPDDYSEFAVGWVLATIFGIAAANPVQRLIIQAGPGNIHRVMVRGCVFLAVVCFLLLSLPFLAMAQLLPLLDNSALLSWGVVLGFIAWSVAAPLRGLANAHQRHGLFSASLGVESGTRILLAVAAWIWPSAAEPLLALVIGLPILLSALPCLAALRVPPVEVTRSAVMGLSLTALVIAALAAQLTLNLGPSWLQLNNSDPTVAGAYVSANSLMKIPMMLSAGLSIVTISSISELWRTERHNQIRELARRTATVASVGSAGIVAALLLFSTPLLHLFYGPDIPIGLGTLAVMGLGTVVSVVAAILTQSALGLRAQRHVAGIWFGAAIIVVGCTWWWGSTALGTALAALVSAGFALVLLALLVRRRVVSREPELVQ